MENQKSDTPYLFPMVASLILAHKEKNINDVDLYNSILRLIYFHGSDEINKEELEVIVRWLDQEEKNNTDQRVQYLKENVIKNAGENYFEGLEMIVVPISHWEKIIKK